MVENMGKSGKIGVSAQQMTADEYRAALGTLGYTQEGFACLVGADPRTGQKWALGEARVPGCVALLVRLLAVRPELVTVANGLGGSPPRSRRAAAIKKRPRAPAANA